MCYFGSSFPWLLFNIESPTTKIFYLIWLLLDCCLDDLMIGFLCFDIVAMLEWKVSHCAKSVCIFWSVFSRIWAEYGIRTRKTPYLDIFRAVSVSLWPTELWFEVSFKFLVALELSELAAAFKLYRNADNRRLHSFAVVQFLNQRSSF